MFKVGDRVQIRISVAHGGSRKGTVARIADPGAKHPYLIEFDADGRHPGHYWLSPVDLCLISAIDRLGKLA